MNTSQGGGVCDCGDVEAWKDSHACEVHQQGQDEDMDEVQHMCFIYNNTGSLLECWTPFFSISLLFQVVHRF